MGENQEDKTSGQALNPPTAGTAQKGGVLSSWSLPNKAKYFLVGVNRIVMSGQDFLTYMTTDEEIGVGSIVSVEVGKQMALGVVLKKVRKPSFPCKEIALQIFPRRLPEHLVRAIRWMGEYYFSPVPLIVQSMVPESVVRKKASVKSVQGTQNEQHCPRPSPRGGHASPSGCRLPGCRSESLAPTSVDDFIIPLNKDQKEVTRKFEQFEGSTLLLHGVTGSGKTNIYLELCRRTLEKGESAVVLVPEIALSSQLNDKFREVFGERVVEIHSKQTPAERRDIWQRVLLSDEPLIIVGPRSALFAPVAKLGLIVIDEAHEPSYRQDKTPKYNAVRLASQMAAMGGFKTILGTATPLVSDYAIARQKDAIIALKTKAIETKTDVKITTVDMKNKELFSQHRFISDALLKSIREGLKNGQQSLIFHNRRGSSNMIACEECGYQALCPMCRMPLTLHHDKFKVICHLCGWKDEALKNCPDCKSPKIVYKGFGTKTVEEELKKIFRDEKIARFDSDTAADQTMNKLYDQVKSGEYGIIIGTQSIAKGFDLPNLTTVGILQADSGLTMPDYMSNERVFELLSQVIGRVGRGHTSKAEVVIQTYQPENPIVKMATQQDYEGLASLTLKERKRDFFPPFSHLLKLVCSYKTEGAAIKNCSKTALEVRRLYPGVKIFGPAPAFYEYMGGKYRWQIVIKSARRQELLDILAKVDLHMANWSVDLDPFNLL